jgi:DNA-binding SARP family transcriptional activator
MIGAPKSLKVTTLGQFSILRDQDVLSGGNWKRRRVCELFKLLLSAEQHRLHREQVQELLWPSSPMEQAANSFGKTLYLLRRALEPELATGKSSTYVSLDHDTVFLVPGSMLIDADLFESTARQVQANMHSDQLKESQWQQMLIEFDSVLSLYGGNYLPDDLYEDWAQRRRDRLHRIYCLLLEQAAKIAVVSVQGQRALGYLRSLLEYNNTDEQTHRELMLIYSRMGRRAEALNQYQLLCAMLREELHASPLPETVELYRSIQAGRVPVDLAASDRLPDLRSAVAEALDSPLHVGVQAAPDRYVQEFPIDSDARLDLRVVQDGNMTVSDQFDPGRVLCAELVGRDEELLRLQRAYAAICEGRQRIFFISGEAGIGKTRLAREFCSLMQGQRATVLWGNCYEMSGALPYQPIIDMLSGHISSCSSEQLRSMLGSSIIDLAKIVPELRLKLPDLPLPEPLGPEVERRNLYNAVACYFNVIASDRPLLLILDDLQWADTATMQLLSYLLMHGMMHQTIQRSTFPCFLLLYRADEVHVVHPLRELLSTQMRLGHAEEMRLKRLKKDQVQRLLGHMAGHEVRASFAEEIYKHTEGNPFFIGESIRALIEEGKIQKVGERWQATVALNELALPQSVRLLIERRLAHLSSECRVTLAYAAVLGRQFNSTLLCLSRNLSDESIAQHIDDAIEAQILTALDGNTYETGNDQVISLNADLMFTHDKIREVLALWLNPLRRRTAHRQIAQAIETRYSSRLSVHYSQLAYHYQMADEITKAVEYLQKAAAQAMSVYAFVDAASFIEKAVELLIGQENRPQRAELLRKLSIDAYLYTGRPDKAIEAGIAACVLWQELGDLVKEAESRLDVSFSFHWMGRETSAMDYIRRAFTCLASAPQETRLLAKAHVQWGLSATTGGDIPTALAQLQLADALHGQIGGNDPFIGVVSLWARSWCAFASDTLQSMLDYALQSAAFCRTIRMFAWEPMMTYSVAWALMLMGQLEEAAHVARETLENAQRHNAVGAQGWAYLVQSFIAIQQGQWDEAEHFADEAAAIASMMSESDLLSRVCWGRSICSGWLGNWEQAIEHSLEALQILQRSGEFSIVYPYLLLQVAKAHFHAGKLECAQHYLDQSMQFADEHHYRQLPAIGHRVQGRILQAYGKFDQAHNHFEQALAELTALNDTVEYARTQQAYGLFFQDRNHAGDQERSPELLQQAQTTFDKLGING